MNVKRNRRLSIQVEGLSIHEEMAIREFLYQIRKKYKDDRPGWVCYYVDTEVKRIPRIYINDDDPVSTGKFMFDPHQKFDLSSSSTVCIDSDYSFTWEDVKNR